MSTENKVNISVSINRNTLRQLQKLKQEQGISISWLVNKLLKNYLNGLEGGANV